MTADVEFFEIDEAVPDPRLDREGTELPLDIAVPSGCGLRSAAIGANHGLHRGARR